jgi:hypothetical protein
MKRKLIVIIGILLCLCGCTNVKNLKIDDILSTFSDKAGHVNVYRTGYKYSLPRGLQVENYTLYNETLTNAEDKFYLYVDMISYHNKTKFSYQESNSVYYSKAFNYNNCDGYLEINLKENNKYLIEIMYNYAKIEVMVDKDDINSSILYAISVLKGITYNDSVIANLIGDDILNYADENYNIFNTTSSDSNYLNYDKEYKGPDVDKNTTHDSDLVN